MAKAILYICFGAFIVILGVILSMSREDSSFDSGGNQPEIQRARAIQSDEAVTLSQSDGVLRYALGDIDSRFEISEEALLASIREASSVWEKAAGFNLFRYDAGASLKIHLVFDSRQQRKIEERRVKATLDERGKSYNLLVEDYESEIALKRTLESDYEADVVRFNERSRDHQSKVSYWNGRGGAPAEEYSLLKQATAELDLMREGLERRRAVLQQVVATVNSAADSINRIVSENNLDISNYNGRFVLSREFEKGLFNGQEINIYEFDGREDLRLTLVHELGHALGFGHVDDPESVMFYKLEKQDSKNIHLTAQDLQLLNDRYPSRAQVP